ncbi:hypothetical protein C2845_PM04G28530 [Panicum miliaceum]|uniref:Uncharacterized protein n=1 Tax=Panicum miliaceum TaxID=4540 RepID=A0A3L6QLZ6_PANMI|nr:hypothetical protein C2845_PM04G28530 [Panicum miliaceum]
MPEHLPSFPAAHACLAVAAAAAHRAPPKIRPSPRRSSSSGSPTGVGTTAAGTTRGRAGSRQPGGGQSISDSDLGFIIVLHRPTRRDGRRVAECRLPTGCSRCHGLRRIARQCKRPRSPPRRETTTSGAGSAPRCFVRVRRRTHSPGTPRGSAGSTPPPPEDRRSASDANPAPMDVDDTNGDNNISAEDVEELPPGHPREENRLRLAIVAMAVNASQDALPGVRIDDISARPFYPENFIFVCPTQALRDAVLGAGTIPVAGTRLFGAGNGGGRQHRDGPTGHSFGSQHGPERPHQFAGVDDGAGDHGQDGAEDGRGYPAGHSSDSQYGSRVGDSPPMHRKY